MFTLLNFDKQINATILQRGKEYYSNGYVVSPKETGDNRWTAEVEGSETYIVEINFKQGYEISEYNCNCPYEGDTCKHVAAVLFALRNEVKTEKIQPKKTMKKEVFDNLLQSLTTKEYQDFIRSYTNLQGNTITTAKNIFKKRR